MGESLIGSFSSNDPESYYDGLEIVVFVVVVVVVQELLLVVF